MQKTRSLGEYSWQRRVLRALGMDRVFASSSLSLAETEAGDSVSSVCHDSTRTALLEAELAKAKAIAFMAHRERAIL